MKSEQPFTYPLTAEQYLQQRVDDQLAWYDRKARVFKKRHRWLKGTSIVLSASIPVLIALSNQMEMLKYVAALCGAVVTIIEGFSAMFRDKDLLLAYRSAREGLMREKMLFLSQAQAYAGLSQKDALLQLVERCEAILGGENEQWNQQLRQEETPPTQPAS